MKAFKNLSLNKKKKMKAFKCKKPLYYFTAAKHVSISFIFSSYNGKFIARKKKG